MDQQNPRREYKDRLFRFIFSDKENALSLYNAINGLHMIRQTECRAAGRGRPALQRYFALCAFCYSLLF